jgi:hypothetical protein
VALMGTGQPYGSILQTAFVVEDIHAAMKTYVDRMGVGPWFLAERFNPAKAVYRGTPNVPLFSLAVAYSGTTMLELIQQHDDTPSVFNEKPKAVRYGFHHWGVAVDNFDAEVARYLAQGYEIAFSDTAPMGMRVAYMDTTKELPGMIELIEGNAAFEGAFAPAYKASLNWDGRDPIRRFG